MTTHEGELTITDPNADYTGLTRVTGTLIIEADAQLPALESVGGGLIVKADAQLPVLESVGGWLKVEGPGSVNAPKYLGRVFREIESDDHYALCRSEDGYYVAGCRGPWSADEALEHWRSPRPDNQSRAASFVLAIERAEGMTKQEAQV